MAANHRHGQYEYIIRKELRDFKDEPSELAYVLIRFFREVKKANGDDYSTSSIWDLFMTMQMVINNYAPAILVKSIS